MTWLDRLLGRRPTKPAPAATPTVPADHNAVPCHGPVPRYVAGAIGPELAQQHSAGRRLPEVLLGDAVANGRGRRYFGDAQTPPQRFPARGGGVPLDAVATNALSSSASLPGRIRPYNPDDGDPTTLGAM